MTPPSPTQPKAGIRDIAAYVPGKSRVEGVEDPIKLSSNENILGSSVQAKAAFLEAAETSQRLSRRLRPTPCARPSQPTSVWSRNASSSAAARTRSSA